MTDLASMPRRTTHIPPAHLTFAHLLRSETIKILTLRSTWWSLGISVALSLGITFLLRLVSIGDDGGMPTSMLLTAPLQFTMLVAGIFGAIVITGEYSTGMIRSTLTAEPRRGAVLLSKAIVISVLMAAVTVATYVVGAVLAAAIGGETLDWSDPSTSLIPLAMGVGSMVVFTLIGLGFGFLLRNGAGAIAVTVGVLFVLPIVFSMFAFGGENWRWLVDLGQYLPANAAARATSPAATDLGGYVITLVVWALAPLAAGWLALRSRDA